jgi:hypothetical protein
MRSIYSWNGYCPECEFKGAKVKMRLNRDDFFECEESRLQIVLTYPGLLATVLKFRGEGAFRIHPDYAHEIPRHEMLCPQTKEDFPFTGNELFNKDELLKEYLEQEVEKQETKQTI